MEIGVVNLKFETYEKKNFEVVISPTDVLDEEMKDVLGGINKVTTTCTKCKRTHCNCDDKGTSELVTELVPGFSVVDHILVEID